MISGKGDDGDGNASLISGASGNGKKAHHFHAWLYVDKQDNSPGLLASIAKSGLHCKAWAREEIFSRGLAKI